MVSMETYDAHYHKLAQDVLPRLGYTYVGSVSFSHERVWWHPDTRRSIDRPSLTELPLLHEIQNRLMQHARHSFEFKAEDNGEWVLCIDHVLHARHPDWRRALVHGFVNSEA